MMEFLKKNFYYYTLDIYNLGNNFQETMNLYNEIKKNVFKIEIGINQMNKSSIKRQMKKMIKIKVK